MQVRVGIPASPLIYWGGTGVAARLDTQLDFICYNQVANCGRWLKMVEIAKMDRVTVTLTLNLSKKLADEAESAGL